MIWFNKKITLEDADKTLTSLEKEWLNFTQSTEPVNLPKLQSDLTQVYKMLGYGKPQVVLFASPFELGEFIITLAIDSLTQEQLKVLTDKIKTILSKSEQGFLKKIVAQISLVIKNNINTQIGDNINRQFTKLFKKQNNHKKAAQTDSQLKTVIQGKRTIYNQKEVFKQINKQRKIKLDEELLLFTLGHLAKKINNRLVNHALRRILNSLTKSSSVQQLGSLADSFVKNLLSVGFICPENLCLSAIEFNYYHYTNQTIISDKQWQIWQNLISNSGWLILYQDSCFICDRPKEMHLNSNYQLHQEGKLAIRYGDGRGLYAYQGVILPPQYGQVKPENWQPQWLLAEKNAELRRVLIQGIGYDKIASELQAEAIDSWREYKILRFNNIIDDIDGEPICLLKMNCPSTNFIHALRIPPDFTSAREAIRWINWGIDPEDMIMES